VIRPAASEEHLAREMPRDRALRLSGAKAKAVAAQRPDAIVIGSDQVASLGSRVLDKPGDAENCRNQLASLSGQTARFHTGCAVVANGERLIHLDTTSVQFRVLTSEEITRYVEREKPFDCAGGFKAEALGITLMESIESRDPTALIGLPLIWLASALRSFGISLP
jgi:septum formation protein